MITVDVSKKDAYKAVGNTIRIARNALGLSLEAVGDATGFTGSHISLVELGHRRAQRELCLKLAEVLHLSARVMLQAYGWASEDVAPTTRLQEYERLLKKLGLTRITRKPFDQLPESRQKKLVLHLQVLEIEMDSDE